MNEQEGAEAMEMPVADSPLESVESPATSGGSPETSGEGSPCSNRGDQLEELEYQKLLRQYGLSQSSDDTQDQRSVAGGPIRNSQARRPAQVHPYVRPESPELDLPQTLLDLHDAALRLASGQK